MQLFARNRDTTTTNRRSANGSTPKDALPAGTTAPDFALKRESGEILSLDDLKGKPTILAFYPADWSPVCGDQMTLYNELVPIFEDYNAQLIGVSVDSQWSHRAFAEARNLRFPLLADFEPKGQVAKNFGVYDDDAGNAERALFVLDAEGMIRWSYVSPKGINPGADGILAALESMDR